MHRELIQNLRTGFPSTTDLYRAATLIESLDRGWLRVIDDALVINWIGAARPEDTNEEAQKKLDQLIQLHVDIATDPAVNGNKILVDMDEYNTLYKRYQNVRKNPDFAVLKMIDPNVIGEPARKGWVELETEELDKALDKYNYE